jgi:hypothetical protein
MSDTPNVEDPNESASDTEGDDQDIEPVGSELLELGEVLEWDKATSSPEAEENDQS